MLGLLACLLGCNQQPEGSHGDSKLNGSSVSTRSSAKPEVSLLDFGSVGQGGNDTAVIQAALNSSSTLGKRLRVPSAPNAYNVDPIFIPSNADVVFNSGVVVQANLGFTTSQRLLNITNSNNVSIDGYGAIFKMRKSEYTSGEWRHCLGITNSMNVEIYGIECSDSGGDGVYIEGTSENIIIQDAVFDNNRRQGMSIISAKDLWVTNCQFTHTNGTPPEAGIDIEPNLPTDRLVNIHLDGNLTDSNNGAGIMVSIYALTSASADVSITIDQHLDRNSGWDGFIFTSQNEAMDSHPKGVITIQNSQTIGALSYGAIASYWSDSGPSITFDHLTVMNANQGRGQPTTGAYDRTDYGNVAVAVYRGGNGIGFLGNVAFLNPTIIDNEVPPKIDTYFYFWDWSNIGIKDVKFLNPVLLHGATTTSPYGWFQPNGWSPVYSVNQ